MIFNSISREINKNSLNNFNPIQDNNKYFPNKYAPVHHNQNVYTSSSFYKQQNPSRISQLNEEISSNIEFLRYKDHRRYQDLKSSQISHKSNHSSISAKPYQYSPSKSTSAFKQKQYPIKEQLRQPIIQNLIPSKQSYMRSLQLQKPQQFSNIKVIRPEHIKTQQSNLIKNYYIPERRHKDKQDERLLKNYRTQFLNQKSNNQFMEFTRKPVILENKPDLHRSSAHFRQIDRPSKDNQDLLANSMHSNYSDKFSTFSKQLKSQQNRAPDISALILSQNLTKTKSNSRQSSSKLGRTQHIMKIEDLNENNTQNQAVLSPLPSKSKRNNSLILSAGLIALGIIIFLLQILK